jgi:hypothetical protein
MPLALLKELMKFNRRQCLAFALAAGALLGGCSRTSVAPFHELDLNGDGRISEQEATHDVVLSEIFADVDGDENGELTAFEYLQAANAP